VRQAIEAVGVSSPLADRAVADAGADPSLLEAYKQQEKTAVKSNIKDNEDFSPNRFPNAHNVYNSK